ncbi:hypothetical protein SNEBB_003502 [Seison nebaliae]|nr:hypothetical protein SNEBB_003502 [Seison nebaliae]
MLPLTMNIKLLLCFFLLNQLICEEMKNSYQLKYYFADKKLWKCLGFNGVYAHYAGVCPLLPIFHVKPLQHSSNSSTTKTLIHYQAANPKANPQPDSLELCYERSRKKIVDEVYTMRHFDSSEGMQRFVDMIVEKFDFQIPSDAMCGIWIYIDNHSPKYAFQEHHFQYDASKIKVKEVKEVKEKKKTKVVETDNKKSTNMDKFVSFFGDWKQGDSKMFILNQTGIMRCKIPTGVDLGLMVKSNLIQAFELILSNTNNTLDVKITKQTISDDNYHDVNFEYSFLNDANFLWNKFNMLNLTDRDMINKATFQFKRLIKEALTVEKIAFQGAEIDIQTTTHSTVFPKWVIWILVILVIVLVCGYFSGILKNRRKSLSAINVSQTSLRMYPSPSPQADDIRKSVSLHSLKHIHIPGPQALPPPLSQGNQVMV